MTADDIKSILFDFMKRAASTEATSDEVRVLPEVARVLLETVK